MNPFGILLNQREKIGCSDDVKQRLDDLLTILVLVDKVSDVLIISYVCEVQQKIDKER